MRHGALLDGRARVGRVGGLGAFLCERGFARQPTHTEGYLKSSSFWCLMRAIVMSPFGKWRNLALYPLQHGPTAMRRLRMFSIQGFLTCKSKFPLNYKHLS